MVILAAAVLGFHAQPRFDVGVFNDDADYVLAARALRTPHTLPLGLFDSESLRNRLPGWPLLLAPWASHAEPPFHRLRVIPLACFILSLVWLALLLRRIAAPLTQLILLSLYAFNPSFIAYSGLLMSEMFFMAIVLGVMLILVSAHANRLSKRVLLATLLAWAALTRAEGVALVIAAGGVPVVRRQWKTAAWLTGPAWIVMGLYFLFNMMLTSSPGVYADVWWSLIKQSQGQAASFWGHHTLVMLRALFLDNLLAWPWPMNPVINVLVVVGVSLGVAGAASVGIRRLIQGSERERAIGLAMSVFLLAYLGIHLVCAFTDARYFFVLVPLLLIGMAKALEKSSSSTVRRGGVLGAALILLLYAWQNLLAWRSMAVRPLALSTPIAAFQWIRQGTPPTSRFATWIASPRLTLYTGRAAINIAPHADPDLFYDRLLRDQIDYLLYEPNRVGLEEVSSTLEAKSAWDQLPTALEQFPWRFKKVYSNPVEGVTVYHIQPNASFLKAYALYRAALRDFGRSDWGTGLEKLQTAIRLEPTLTSAMNAFGATCLLSGTSFRAGEKMLARALQIRPDYGVARANLARLRARLTSHPLSHLSG